MQSSFTAEHAEISEKRLLEKNSVPSVFSMVDLKLFIVSDVPRGHEELLRENPSMEIVGIIPARYQSTRFPGKPLADLHGKPMIQHVFERARKSVALNRLFVATDDTRIFEAVQAFGGESLMTAADHPSGTDRLAEAAERIGLSGEDVVVNIQGDEPLVQPQMIETLVKALIEAEDCPMATLAFVSCSRNDFLNPNVVKLVMDLSGRALYFSRSPIPFFRDEPGKVQAGEACSKGAHRRGLDSESSAAQSTSPQPAGDRSSFLRHLGYYAYRQSFLQIFTRLSPTPLETAEKLEQLRAMEYGYSIKVAISPWETIGVDTPRDLEEVSKRMNNTAP